MSYLDNLSWRYAVKTLNGKQVSDDKITNILRATQLAVSSVGLQPYTIFVIKNKGLQTKIQKFSNDQSAIGLASHVLVFTTWTEFTDERRQQYIEGLNSTGKPGKMWAGYIDSQREKLGANGFFLWMQSQTHLAFSNAVFATALEEVDACPMEGFSVEEMDKLLELPKHKLQSSLMLPLGYRDPENDWNANNAKYRRNFNDLFQFIK